MRLIGLGIAALAPPEPVPPDRFDDGAARPTDNDRERRLTVTMGRIHVRFGAGALRRGLSIASSHPPPQSPRKPPFIIDVTHLLSDTCRLVAAWAGAVGARLKSIFRDDGSDGMALTKADLAEHLFEELGLSKSEAKDLVERFFEAIRASLERGDEVKLSGFGNFELHEKRERPGRNPKTGEAVPISARRVVTFRAGQKLKARVEAYVGPAQRSAEGSGATPAAGA